MSKEREWKTLAEARAEANIDGLECRRCGCRHFEVEKTIRKDGRIRRIRVCRHCGKKAVTVENWML